jgi:hypothetical protein
VIGAALARRTGGSRGYPLAFAIAGHHGGLADRAGQETPSPRALDERLSTSFLKYANVYCCQFCFAMAW